ncbi:MAG: gliding motility-associated C-terminal domain-containing protein [Saprospiraceae bacterium]
MTALFAQEVCNDGLDNDGDNLVDCFDPGCSGCAFNCEYKVPSSGLGSVALGATNAGVDPDYTTVFVAIDSTGDIQYLTTSNPPTFTGVSSGRYLALAVTYLTNAGINNLVVGNNIGIVYGGCMALSKSYAFEVCTNTPPVVAGIESSPSCFCAGETLISNSITASDADQDSLTATVRIATGYVIGEDRLVYNGAVPITSSFNVLTGELTLGPAPPANINFALKKVAYFNTSAYGSETPGNRSISFSVSDGLESDGPETRTVRVGNPLCPCAGIMASKAVSNVAPAQSGTDGNVDVTYTFTIQNTGGMDLGRLAMPENLAAQLGNAFVGVVSTPSILAGGTATVAPTPNASFNGNTNTDLFNGTSGRLKPGQSFQVAIVVEVDNSEAIPVLENQATVTGVAIDGSGNPVTDGLGQPVTTSDPTDNGVNPTTNNGSGGTNDPTPLVVPAIALTKALVSSLPATGQPANVYKLQYEYLVKNTGTTYLEDIRVADDLSAWGAALLATPAPVVELANVDASTLPTNNNGNFDGTSDTDLLASGGTGLLHPGESFKIKLTVFVDIAQATSGLINQGLATATPTNGAGTPIGADVNDLSDDASGLPTGNPESTNPGATGDSGGPDDPTPVAFPALPLLTKSITAEPVLAGDHTYAVPFQFLIQNQGGGALCNLNLVENFVSQYGCAFENVLSVSSVNLANTSGNSIAPTRNTTYDGGGDDNLFNGDGCLYPGDEITLNVVVEINVSCLGVDEPLVNQAIVSGLDPNTGNLLSDLSDDATDLDGVPGPDNDSGGENDPTLLEIPTIRLAKEQVSSTTLPDGKVEVTYQFIAQNTGNVTLHNIALEDDISSQFGAAFVSASTVSIAGSATTQGNTFAGFTGSGTTGSAAADGDDLLDRLATLKPGENIVVSITVVVDPALVPAMGLTNQAMVEGTTSNGGTVSDLSDNGTHPNTNNGEGGSDDPTPLNLGPIPVLTKALTAAPTLLPSGNYQATYLFSLTNTGTGAMCSIDVFDDLHAEFGCALASASAPTLLLWDNASGLSTQPNFNGLYNGLSQINMFVGNGCIFPEDKIQWSITVELNPDCSPLSSPLINQATVMATDTDGNSIEDDSDDASDVDGDLINDNESGGTDDPTFIYLPNIAVTKAITGSTALPNGHVLLDFRFNIENTGNADLSNLSLTDPLNFTTAIIGTPMLSLTNVNATAVPATNNGAYTGVAPDTDLLVGAATDRLKPGQSFVVFMSVEVDPQQFGLLPQPIENQATVTGFPVNNSGIPLGGYASVSDVSDDGTGLQNGGDPTTGNPGADNDNGVGGTDDPTVVSLPPTPKLTKAITATPVPLPNGNYAVTYALAIENLGGSEFCIIGLEEDFASQFGCAFEGVISKTAPVLTNTSGLSTNPTLNSIYNGSTSTGLLNGDGCLYPGDAITMSVTVEVSIGCTPLPAPLANTATVTGVDNNGHPVSDDSDDSTDLDTDTNPDNETGGPDDPTLLLIPEISLTKALTSTTALPNGNYQLAFRFNIENTGNTNLSNLSVTDLLNFSPAIVGTPAVSVTNVDATAVPAGNNGVYTGIAPDNDLLAGAATDKLEPGQSFVIVLGVEVNPQQFGLLAQPIENQAVASGNPVDASGNDLPALANPTDDSDDGTSLPNGGDPTTGNPGADNDNGAGGTEDPTIVSLPPIPNLIKAITTAPTQLPNGNYAVTFGLSIENLGGSEFCTIGLEEDFASQFGCAFEGVISKTAPLLTNTSGLSTNPTLNSIYNGSTSTGLLNGDGCLYPGDVITMNVTVEIDINCSPLPAPLANTATVTGVDNQGNPVSDDSDDNTDLDGDTSPDNETGGTDDPTLTLIPDVAITKALTDVTPLPNGNYHLDFRFNIKNTGNVILSDLSVADPLNFTSAIIGTPSVSITNVDASAAPTANNGAYTGTAPDTDLLAGASTDKLEPGQSFVIYLGVDVNPLQFGLLSQPVENQAVVTGNPVDGSGIELTGLADPTDASDDGTGLPNGGDPNSDNPNAGNDNGAGGTDDPTLISLPARLQLSKAITGVPVPLANGNYDIAYEFRIENLGGSEVCLLGLEEDFAAQYGCAFVGIKSVGSINLANTSGNSTSPTANTVYNGGSVANLFNGDGCLFPGDEITVSLIAEIDNSCTGIHVPLVNQATVTGEDPSGNPISDNSDDETDLDGAPGPDNDSGGANDPTLLSIPEISLAKEQVSSTLLGNGHFEVVYKLVVKNTGNVALNNVALEDDISTQFAPAFVSAHALSMGGTASILGGLNPSFTGSGATGSALADGDDILNRTGILLPGNTIMAQIAVEIDPTLVPAIGLFNQATATGTTPDGDMVGDVSDNGANPDGNNGNGGSDDETPLNLGPVPVILKKATATPALLPNGDYAVRYEFTVRNNGAGEMCNINVSDDLAAQFGCAFVNTTPATWISFSNTSGLSVQPTLNTIYNGGTHPDFFNGDGCLFPGDEFQFFIDVKITNCAAAPHLLANQATVTAVDPDGGNLVSDTSDDETDLDSSNTPDNESGSGGDPTLVFLPDVAITKAVTGASALANGNVLLNFRFIIKNTGNTDLSNLSVADPLNFLPAIVGTPAVSIANVSATMPPSSNNGLYNGNSTTDLLNGSATDLLEPGQAFVINMIVEVEPLAFGLLPQPIENQATVTGTPQAENGNPIPGYGPVQDASDDGTGLSSGGDPASDNPGAVNDNGAGGTDDPTIVTLPSAPAITKMVVGVPVALPNGNHSVTYEFSIGNMGGSRFCQIGLQEDLASQFDCAFVQVLGKTAPMLTNTSGLSINPTLNSVYSGISSTNLLNNDGCLYPGDFITLTIEVEVDVNCETAANPLANTATVTGVDDNGNPVSDDSDDRTDLNGDSDPDNETGGTDDPTLTLIPDVAITKSLTATTPLANGNYQFSFRFNVENTGNVSLSNLSVADPLTFGAAVVGLPTVSVTNIDATNAPVPSLSYDGVGMADLLDGAPTNRLEPGQSFYILMSVEVNPVIFGAFPQPVENQATVTGDPIDASGNPLTGLPSPADDSDDGTDLPNAGDPNSNNPGADNDLGTSDDPTLLSLPPIVALNKSLTSAPVLLPNGHYSATYAFQIENKGGSQLCQIDLTEDFASQFGCAFVKILGVTSPVASGSSTAPTLNTIYNGGTNANLFNSDGCLQSGDTITLSVSVEIDVACASVPSPLANQATVSGEDDNGNDVTDQSDDATDLDGNPGNDNDSGGEDDPTLLYIPGIAVTKAHTNTVQVGNQFRLDFEFIVRNAGNTILENITLEDDLDVQWGAALLLVPDATIGVSNISASVLPSANPDFDGSSDIALLTPGGLLEPGEAFKVKMSVYIDPAGVPLNGLLNRAAVGGLPTDGSGTPLIDLHTMSPYIPGAVTDFSDDGTGLPGDADPLSDNPGAEGDLGTSNDFTPVNIPPIAKLYKSISGLPTALPNGNYAVTYDFRIENVGGSQFCQIDLIENFKAQHGCSFVQILNVTTPLATGTSTAPTRNTVYDGDGEWNVFNSDGCLLPGDEISVSITIETDISCSTRPHPLYNSATVNGVGDDGNPVSDTSDDETDVDGNPGTDNETGSDEDPTILLIPDIALTKALIATTPLPGGNYQLKFRFNIENTGNSNLSNLSLLDPLTFAGAVVGTPVASVVNNDALMPPNANPAYTGFGANQDLLAGAATDMMRPGERFSVFLSVEVDPALFTALPQPVENQATAAGDVVDENGNPLIGYPSPTDDSDDGTSIPGGGDPISDNPSGVNDNGAGGMDDPTLISLPQIKLAKAVSNVVPSNTPGNYYVSFNLVIKNDGNVPLTNIQLTDDLVAQLGSAYVGVTAGPIISTGAGNPILPNAGGSFPAQVFDGASGFMNAGDEINLAFTVEINPDAGGAPNPLTNQARATGDDPNGDEVSDLSDDGTDPDGDNGEGGVDDPTEIPLPQINAAKEIIDISPAASGLANHFDITYRLVVQNTGNQALSNLALTDDLPAQLGAAFVQVAGIPAIYPPLTTATSQPAVNAAFSGANPATDIFSGAATDDLRPGQKITVDIVVEVNPSAPGAPSPIINQAEASGIDTSMITVTDLTDSGADPTTDNGSGGLDDPTEFPCPAANIDLSAAAVVICESEDAAITLVSDVPTASYEWVDMAAPGVVVSTDQNPVFANLTTTTTYQVTVYPNDGCYTDLTETITINVTPTPPAPVVADVEVCEGELLQIGTTTTADAYFWDGPNGWTSDDQNPFVSTAAGLTDGGVYQLSYLENNCWSDKAYVAVTIHQLPPQPTLTNNGPICEGNPIIMSTSSGCDTFRWIGPDGMSTMTLSNPLLTTTTKTTTIPFGNVAYDAGLWSVVCVDAFGCESPASAQVEMVIYPIPQQPLPTNNSPICEGEEITLHAGGNYPAGTLYQWYATDPAQVGAVVISTEQNPTISNLIAAGSYTYWLTVTVNGCVSPAGFTVVIVAEKPEVNASNDGTECVEPMTDLNLGAVATGGTAPYTFAWSGPNSFVSIDQNPILPNAANHLSGTYIVTVTDANGCKDVAETVVDVTLSVAEPFLSYNGPLCEGSQLVITAPAYNGLDVHYEWTGPAGTTSNGAYADAPVIVIDLVEASATGNYAVQVTVDGCTSVLSEPLAVTINESPDVAPGYSYVLNPDCSPSDLLLFANAAAGTGNDLEFLWNGPNGFTSTEANPIIEDVVESYNGSYVLTVTDENGCSNTRTLEVSGITPVLTFPVITGSGQTCEGNTVTLTVPGYQGVYVAYFWNLPGSTANITGLNSNQITISPATLAHAGNYTVTIVVDDCTILSSTYELLIFETPVVTATNDGTECTAPMTDLNLTASASGGAAPYTFQWSGPNGFGSAAQNPIVPNTASGSSGTYTVLLTDFNGCTASASTVVDVTTPPAEPVIFANGPVCEGSEAVLEIPVYNGVDVSYEWTGPNGTTSGGDYPDAPYLQLGHAGLGDAGGYTVRVVVDGCSSVVSVPYVLVVNEAPAVAATNDGTECTAPMTDLNLGASAAGGTAPYTFAWTGPNGFASIGQAPILPNAANNLSGTYTVTLTDANGCTAEAETVVDVTTSPDKPSLSYNGPLCEGGQLVITAPAYNGLDVHYDWAGPAGTTGSGAYPDVAVVVVDLAGAGASGSYTVQVTVDGCTSVLSEPLAVTINEAPEVLPSYSYTLNTDCSPSDLQFFANAAPGSGSALGFLWTGPNGFASTEENPLVPDVAESYNGSYTLTATDENGCSDTRTVEVSGISDVLAMPVVTGSGQACEGSTVTLSVPGYQGVSVSYNWSLPGPAANITGLNSNQITIAPAALAHAGSYSVTIVVDGCTITSGAYELLIFETPVVTATNDGTECTAPMTDLHLAASASGGAAPYTFQWSGPNGFGSAAQNPTVPNTASGSSGTYTVLLTDFNGCTASASTVVDVTTPPAEPVIFANGPVCEGSEAVLEIPVYNGVDVSYEWTGPNGSTSGGDYPNSNFIGMDIAPLSAGGAYTVQVTVDGCTSVVSEPYVLTIYEAPVVSAGNDGTECVTPMTDMNLSSVVNGGADPYTWAWSGPNGFSSTLQNPIVPNVSSADDGNYTVVVTSTQGCTGEATTVVDVTTSPDEPFVTANGPVCEGGEIVLQAPTYAGFDVSYEWVGPNGSTTAGDYPDAPIFAIQQANMGSIGDYQVKVTVDGCTSVWSTAYSLQVNEAPTASPVNNAIPCSVAIDDLELLANPMGGTPPYSFQWSGPNGFTSTFENPVIPNVTSDASGTYTLSVQDVLGCQSATNATVVQISSIPTTPTLAVSSQSLCEGETLELETIPYNGAVVTYNWTTPNGQVIQTDAPSLIIGSVNATDHNGQYQMSVTVDGCTSLVSAQVNVAVTPVPAPPSMPADFSICQGGVLALTTNTVADGYLWTGPNGFVSNLQNPPAVLGTTTASAGTYNLVVFENNCPSAPGTVAVMVEATPAKPVLQTASNICQGDTIFLQTALVPGASYQWISPTSTINSNFGTLGDPDNPIWTTTNSTFITLQDHPSLYVGGGWRVRVLSPSGCPSEESVAVNLSIHQVPSAPPALSNGPVVCEDEVVELITGPVPGGTFFWYEGDPFGTPTGELLTTVPNPSLFNVAPGMHQYFLLVEVAGCMSEDATMVEVEVMDMPDVQSVTNTGPYCAGEIIQLEAPTIAGAQYTWTGPNGFSSFVEDPVILGGSTFNAGIYVLVVKNGGCISNPISTQVLVTAQPSTPIVVNNGPACEGEIIQLSTPSVSNGLSVVYEWTGPNGFTSNLQNPVLDSLTQADEGNYFVTVIVDGCSSLTSAPSYVEVVNIPGIPPATNNTSQANPACFGDEIQLQTPFIPGATYQWTGPGGFVSFISNPVIPDASLSNQGQYSVIVNVAGCASGQNFTDVYVQETPAVPIVVSNGPVCVGEDLVLEVANIDTSLSYSWYDSIGNFQVGTGAQLIFDNAQPSINSTYYVVAAINGCETDPSAINSAGEDAFAAAQVDVPSQDVAFVGDDLFVCKDTVSLSAFPLQFNGTGQWSQLDPANPNGSIINPNSLSTLVVNLPGGENGYVWSIISGACGITSSDTVMVTLDGFPIATDDLYSIGYFERLDSTILLNDVANADGYLVEILTQTTHGVIILQDNGQFTYQPDGGFIGTDEFEYQLCNIFCPDECAVAKASIEVGLDSPCNVPSVFTPNGDGVNDEFFIPCLQVYEGSDLTVFNRWGDEVMHSDDYRNDWLGTYKNNDLPVGTYFYILKLNDGNDTVLKGYIFLQR